MERSTSDPLLCPRCNSSNTKFCYYNNYNLSQPRHFCKACKRYWTRGGTLRNVPVGGGCRKNKKFKRAAAAANGGGADSAKPLSLPPSSNPINSTLFQSFPAEINFPFSAPRVSGLGFSVSPDYGNHPYEQNVGSSSFAPRFAACDELSSLVAGNGEICNNNQIEQIQSYDSSSFAWNSNSVGVWCDPSCSSSSVPSFSHLAI